RDRAPDRRSARGAPHRRLWPLRRVARAAQLGEGRDRQSRRAQLPRRPALARRKRRLGRVPVAARAQGIGRGAAPGARPPAQPRLTPSGREMAQPRLADYAMLLFLGLVWGSSFLFIGVSIKSIPPLTLAALRCLIGALVLLAAARAMGHAIPRDPRAWLSYLAMGLTNSALPFMLITLGQTRIDSGLA